MKLSDKQKEVILLMRKGYIIDKYYGLLTKPRKKIKIRFNTIIALHERDLIYYGYPNNYYLTNFGKTTKL